MGKIEEQRENTITAIELVVKEFLSEDALGKWFSVRERSLGNLMKDVNLDHRYSAAIYEELKNVGMIEKEGERAQLRYKIVTNLIPDARALAERIYERNQERKNQIQADWLETRKGDLTPPHQVRKVTIDEFERRGKKKTVKKTPNDLLKIPRLGEIVYVIISGFITEAKITCVRFDENDKVVVDFVTPITKKNEEGNEILIKKKDWCLKNIFFSIEELIKRLEINIQRFKK